MLQPNVTGIVTLNGYNDTKEQHNLESIVFFFFFFFIILELSWPENQGILFFVYFSNISNEPDIFHGFTN